MKKLLPIFLFLPLISLSQNQEYYLSYGVAMGVSSGKNSITSSESKRFSAYCELKYHFPKWFIGIDASATSFKDKIYPNESVHWAFFSKGLATHNVDAYTLSVGYDLNQLSEHKLTSINCSVGLGTLAYHRPIIGRMPSCWGCILGGGLTETDRITTYDKCIKVDSKIIYNLGENGQGHLSFRRYFSEIISFSTLQIGFSRRIEFEVNREKKRY